MGLVGLLALDADHVDPDESEQGLEGDAGERGLARLELLGAELSEWEPVVHEEVLLGDAEEAGEEREDGQAVLALGGELQSVRVENVHKDLEAGYVDFVADGAWILRV